MATQAGYKIKDINELSSLKESDIARVGADIYRRDLAKEQEAMKTYTAGRGTKELDEAFNRSVYVPTPTNTTMADVEATLPSSNNLILENERVANASKSASDNSAKAAKERIEAEKMLETKKAQIEAQNKLDTVRDERNTEIQGAKDDLATIRENAVKQATNLSNAFFISEEDALASKQKIDKYTTDIEKYYQDYVSDLEKTGHPGQLQSLNVLERNSVIKNYESKIGVANALISLEQGNLSYAVDIVDRSANSIMQINQAEQQTYNTILDFYSTQVSEVENDLGEIKTDYEEQYKGYLSKLEAEATRIEENRNFIRNLMSNSETAVIAHDAGISLTDSEDEVANKLQKYFIKHPETLMNDTEWQFKAGSDGEPDKIFNPKTGEIKVADGMTDPITGVSTDKSKVILGYDFTSYATDPEWGLTVKSIIAGMPELTTIADINAYLPQNSVLSGKGSEIMEVAKEYGISPQLLIAMIQHESVLGTSNVARSNNNFGGVTWNSNYPEEMKGTARPSREGGNYVKFATTRDGIESMAYNISRRKIATENAVTEYDQSVLDWAESIRDGSAKLSDITGDPELKTKVVSAMKTLPPSENAIKDAESMVSQLEELVNHPGLNSSVGPIKGTRIAIWDQLGNKDDFLGKAENLISKKALENLIESKQQGATFGALSEKEMAILNSAATTLGAWSKSDDNNNLQYFDISQSKFKEELQKMIDDYKELIDEGRGYTLESVLKNNPDLINEYNILVADNPDLTDEEVLQLLDY